MHESDAVAQAIRSNPLPLVLAAVVELVVLPAVVQARTARRIGRRRD